MKFENVKKIHQMLGGLNASVVHVAGSKGKGTTSFLLAKIIELHGKKVGLFTSPAILRNEEMIQVNGKCISTEKLQVLIKEIRSAYALLWPLDEKLSEFEEMTLAAFLYFQKENCSYVVVECGWGGKNDATNILEKKAITILTHIELEHTEVLGKTLAEITKNKLGICRPGVPLLTLPSQMKEVFDEIKKYGYVPIIAPSYELLNHHPESAGLAVMAADMLGFTIDQNIHKALEKIVIPGRFEIIKFGIHTLILEGAHTYDSIEYFLERLHEFENKNEFPSPLFGIHILKDKPKDLWTLFPSTKSVWIPIDDERAGEKPDILSASSVSGVFDQLNREKEPQLFVFCGSFKLVAAVKKFLRQEF